MTRQRPPGPPPKRSDQRRRRNKTAPVEHAVADAEVRGYDLEGEHSDLARGMWEALRRSGQARWYQASDWAFAEIMVVALDSFAAKPSATMLASITGMMSSLLATEADRRRCRIELERPITGGGADDVPNLDAYRHRLKSKDVS